MAGAAERASSRPAHRTSALMPRTICIFRDGHLLPEQWPRSVAVSCGLAGLAVLGWLVESTYDAENFGIRPSKVLVRYTVGR